MRHVLRSLLLLTVTVLWLTTPLAAKPLNLIILHLNDWDKMDSAGRVASVIKAEKAKAAENGAAVLVTFGGDMISPSLMSGIDQGAHMIELGEAVGIQYGALGNHEFDFGPEVLKQRLAEADFPWMSSNTLVNGKVFPGLDGSQLVEIDGYKIGIIGLTTPETIFLSSPGATVTFTSYAEAGQREVAALKAQGADFIIVLSHGGEGLDRELTRTLRDVDLVMGGHDHLARTVYDGRDMTAAAGSQGEFVAKVTLTIDRVEKRGKTSLVWSPAFDLIPTRNATPDATVQAKVDGYLATLDKELGQVIGSTSIELDTRRASIRSVETGFGNLVADASRAATGADVGIANGGGIRGDKVYAAGTELTRKDILSELPFGNSTVKLELTGAQLRAVLENGVSEVEKGAGRFAQVSGMVFSYDASKPAGARVVEVTVGGKPLNTAGTYTLATNDYVAGGGDGYAVFKKAKVLVDGDAGGLLAGQVIDYIKAKGTGGSKVEGRITRLD
ncbi:MAG: 5'-nucleotidase C-terminal domain-containing protein [Alphaproteobacteria bacterium]|nr:5'-nucleotidase C-terminal domain-containing protein [Alphaproteobacteria bacterium]